MIELVLEKPWLVGVFGGALTLAAFQWWLSTARREAIQTTGVIFIVTVALVTMGVLVETEQESLRAMLYQTADDLKNNRKSEVLSAIYDRPSEEVVEAKKFINEEIYRFEEASIKKLHAIELSGPQFERRALVKMNVFIQGQFGGMTAKIPRYVELTLYRVEDRWFVYHFTHDQPLAGFQENN